MKVLCCGSRVFKARAVVRHRLSELPGGAIIVHGDAPGADTLCDFAARERGFPVRSYPARWESEGKAAGPLRNARMLVEQHPDQEGDRIDLCLAFTDDLQKSKGTRDMVTRALAVGIPVEVLDSKGGRRAVTAV